MRNIAMRNITEQIKCERPCLVRVKLNNQEKTLDFGTKPDTMENSVSGIIVDESQGFVVTHGSLIAPFLSHHSRILSGLRKYNHFITCDEQISVDVLVQESEKVQSFDINSQPTSKRPKSYFTELLNCSVNKGCHGRSLQQFRGRLISVFKCKKFEDALQHLMPVEAGWKFNENYQKQSDVNDTPTNQSHIALNDEVAQSLVALLPCFVLIGLEMPVRCDDEPLCLPHFQQCRIGDMSEVVATPFGGLSPEVFMNSYSKGVISNVSGGSGVLMLTDARCIPGSEGGALYVRDANGIRCLQGIIVSPLCWKNNEWIGLALACSLREILYDMADVLSSASRSLPIKPGLKTRIDSSQLGASPESMSVVLVRSGSTWGSGVLIDHQLGLLLTCSHVVKWGTKPAVLVKFPVRRRWFTADILYCTPAGQQFDIAVLQTRDPVPEGTRVQPLSAQAIKEGLDVQVTGHALFDEDRCLTPSVTSGVISKITKFSEIPVLIQTTCAVHAGASGGVVTDQVGHLLAIVVCNAKDISTGACYPHVNLCVPINTIWPVIDSYRKSKDKEVLKALHISNQYVQKLWNLGMMDNSRGEKPTMITSKL
ncbi:peroxisomal leader peptide-processing protease-like [Liolophura sinensis]|uniref:peroxisomal leader peptide-processing protease-like n=1 Tax=Liolophura sinensis TaxID=3198878 RepID=UPI003158AA51